jgi:hypothetical protein
VVELEQIFLRIPFGKVRPGKSNLKPFRMDLNPIVLQFVRGDILSVTDWKEVEGAKEAVE